jgi:hypothetical protein
MEVAGLFRIEIGDDQRKLHFMQQLLPCAGGSVGRVEGNADDEAGFSRL